MKKSIFTIFALIIFAITGYSQDLITENSGNDINAKILEVTSTEVKYKKTNFLDGPTFTILKSDILMIRYANGTKDVFGKSASNVKPEVSEEIVTSDESMAIRGAADAKANYKGRNSGAAWTGASAFLVGPILALAPAILCSSAEPLEENLNVKNPELMKNFEYNKAYTEKAHKIKKSKVWTGFGIGTGVLLALVATMAL